MTVIRPENSHEARELRRRDVYRKSIVDGRERRETSLTAIVDGLRGIFASKAAHREAYIEQELRRPMSITRPNTVTVMSPNGGVGKTATTFVLGHLLASRLKVRVVAIDANPDFGTLASLAPDDRRSRHSLTDLLDAMGTIFCSAEVLRFVSRLASGLHILAAPVYTDVMAQMTPALYGDLLAFLGQYYEVVLLDLGSGITNHLAQFAVQRADQVVLVTTPEWITSTTASGALRHLSPTPGTLVLNQAHSRHVEDGVAIRRLFAEHELVRQVEIPYDVRLRTMLDSGTYALDALERRTRLGVKGLGLEVARELV